MKLNATWIAAGLVIVTAFGCKPPPPLEPEVPASAKVKSFTVDKVEAAEGDQVTLSWEVTDAKSISIATQSGESVQIADATAATGSTEAAVETSTVFVLTAHGEGGSDTAAVSVVIPAADPAVVFTAVPQKVIAGQPTTLVWNVPGAAQVKVTGPGGETVYDGEKNASSIQITPTSSGQYTLQADGETAEVQVDVTAGILGFAPSAQAVLPGAPVTLSWKVGGAESVTLSAEGRGELTTVTDPAQVADGSFEDTVPASLPNNGLVKYTLTAKAGAQQLAKSLTVWVGADPLITSFQVPGFAKLGASYQVTWSTLLADHLEIVVDGTVVHVATSAAEVQSGAFILPSPEADSTVELRATNARGGMVTQSATISPVDVTTFVSFTANPLAAANGGDPVTLSWEVTNARHIVVTRKSDGKVLLEKSGPQLDTGSIDVYPNGPVEYQLDADNMVGDPIQTQTITADVTNPATLVFSPAPVPAGTQVQLTGTTVVNGGALRSSDIVQKNLTGDSFVDISGTGTVLPFSSGDDTVSKLVQLSQPFQTELFGKQVGGDKLSVSINGWAVFSPSTISGSGSPDTSFPSTDYEPFAFVPWGKDLQAMSATRVYWAEEGSGASRRVILQWDDVKYYGDSTKVVSFEVQLYADHVVFAYSKVNGISSSSDHPAIGIVNEYETGASSPNAGQLTNGLPSAGETFRFFGDLSLPLSVTASTTPIHVIQKVGQGEIDLIGSVPLIPAGQFAIAEVNHNPASGQEQWFEVENFTAQSINLGGWYIDFGGGTQVPIPSGTILPANGRLVFGQSANSAEANNGGAAVDVAYGTGFVMPAASGSIAIGISGGTYTQLAWTTAGNAGESLVADPGTGLTLASGVTYLSCASVTGYGSNGQKGTPGAANNHCFPWALSSIPGNFQSILATGHPISDLQPTYKNACDSKTTSVDFTAAGGHAVKIGNAMYGDASHMLPVSSNGWMSLVATSSSTSANSSKPSDSDPNGTLAILWDDLAGNATGSGVFWQQFDPDGIPGNSDDYTLISWENWKQYYSDGSLNFQIRIEEATGSIEYHYGTMTSTTATYADGTTATEWLESLDGKAALKIGANQSVIQPNTGYRFAYTP